MAEDIDSVIFGIEEVYDSFLKTLPQWGQDFTNLFMLVATIMVFSAIVWVFYKVATKKNIIILNLNKYNKFENIFTNKIFYGIFYFLEYIVITPFFIFIWFSILTIFLILLTEDLGIQRMLFVAATVVSAVRMASYYKEELAKEIAKLLPFTLLAVAILTPGFFNFSRIIKNFSQLPAFFDNFLIYLLFIAGLETILRFFEFIFSLFEIKNQE